MNALLAGRIVVVIFGLICWCCFVRLLVSYDSKYGNDTRANAWVCFAVSLIVFGIVATVFTITQ
nr:MAG TPA: hypothetical protein [Caudoviricetes sp.]